MSTDDFTPPTFDEALARELAQSPDDPYAPYRAVVNAVHGLLLRRGVEVALSAQAVADIKERLATVEMMAKDHTERLKALEAGT